MLDFSDSLDGFLASLFTFINNLLNGVFGWLSEFFSGLNIDIS